MPNRSLPIYLNDHLALMTTEIELAYRAARENEGTPLGKFLAGYASEVEQQRVALQQTLETLGGNASTLKQALGWLAEKAGRLKPNDALSGYTDLARVIELETLISLAHARLNLSWTLQVWDIPAELNGEQLLAALRQSFTESLIERQLASLHEQHRQAAAAAFQFEVAH